MKNTFLITEDEKKRILGMHVNATKNHYLNESTYTVSGMSNSWKIYKDGIEIPGEKVYPTQDAASQVVKTKYDTGFQYRKLPFNKTELSAMNVEDPQLPYPQTQKST